MDREIYIGGAIALSLLLRAWLSRKAKEREAGRKWRERDEEVCRMIRESREKE